MTDQKKKEVSFSNYMCSTEPSSQIEDPVTQNLFYSLPETQNLFYSPSNHLSGDPSLTENRYTGVDECGIYQPLNQPLEENNQFSQPSFDALLPSPLYCVSNRIDNLLMAFNSLISHLQLSSAELSNKKLTSFLSSSSEKHLQDINTLLHKIKKIKNQTTQLKKKFVKSMTRIEEN